MRAREHHRPRMQWGILWDVNANASGLMCLERRVALLAHVVASKSDRPPTPRSSLALLTAERRLMLQLVASSISWHLSHRCDCARDSREGWWMKKTMANACIFESKAGSVRWHPATRDAARLYVSSY